MKVLIITPPIVQLNTPYPAGAFLKSFFQMQDDECVWKDLNIELFYEIFSRKGLTKLFELSQPQGLEMAIQAEKRGDDNTAFNIRRYISQKQNWIDWIETIVAILCGKAREKEHQFLYSPFAPRGARMENYLASLEKEPTVEDVRFLCSYALADLADYITTVFDKSFSFISYAEQVVNDEINFSKIECELESPVMKNFYDDVLVRVFEHYEKSCDGDEKTSETKQIPDIVGISVPFAGTFLPSLYTARFVKQRYGDKTFVAMGGGFVNTQLREVKSPKLAKYVDAFSFDRGYGSFYRLKEIFPLVKEKFLNVKENFALGVKIPQIYKMRFFTSEKVIEPLMQENSTQKWENEITTKVIPCYDDIDFSVYPRLCDDKNPMHRIWSDGAWIKAYLAHGCYWHKCKFCDTKLDYVCGYKTVDINSLFQGLLQTAKSKNVYGIHFVDEALPPVALKKFALLNAREKNPLYFWGNIRFEKSFTKDLAAFLSYCGFGSASAGLEVTTNDGLQKINKGTDIQTVVKTCAAFKESGILLHSYMIYGFWFDTPQSIINSMEILRQMFAEGLLDSAFWHKFSLTKDSKIYEEMMENHQNDKNEKNDKNFTNGNFNNNSFEKFGLPLEMSLNSWMHGEKLEMKVQKWFDFQVPTPTVERDFVQKIITEYEENNAHQKWDINNDVYWIGSEPVLCVNEDKNPHKKDKKSTYTWIYLQEEFFETLESDVVESLKQLKPCESEKNHLQIMEQIKKSPELQKHLQSLKNRGLVCI